MNISKRYVLYVYHESITPELKGPYSSEKTRKSAIKRYVNDADFISVFPIDIYPDKEISVVELSV